MVFSMVRAWVSDFRAGLDEEEHQGEEADGSEEVEEVGHGEAEERSGGAVE